MSVTFAGSPTGPVQWQVGKGGDGFYARIDPVGTGSSLRYWQGNNSGYLTAASQIARPLAPAGRLERRLVWQRPTVVHPSL